MNATRSVLTLVLALAAPGVVLAQDELFTTNHGGARPDGAYAIEATSDGGFIASGFSESFSPNSFIALYLVKTDADGEAEWSRTYELSTLETHGAAIVEVPGGGYAVAGRAGNNNAGFDSFLLRVDPNGNEMWRRYYDAGDDDRTHALALSPDGGFMLAGQAWFINGPFGNYDLRVVKTDADGRIEWARTYEYEPIADDGHDIALGVASVSTGGYAIAGFTQSGIWAGWLLRTDELGNLLWNRVYDTGWISDELSSVQEAPAGGFILGGAYGNYDRGDVDMALVRTDDLGVPIWTRTFGSPNGGSQGQSVRAMPDGGFVLAGMSATVNTGWDMLVVRTDAEGDLLWQRRHGGDGDDRAHSVAVGRDRLVAAGWAWSYGAGFGDIHLIGLADPALACAADLDGDADADSEDFFAYLDLFAADDPASDLDNDGDSDADDFFMYLDLFAAGC